MKKQQELRLNSKQHCTVGLLCLPGEDIFINKIDKKDFTKSIFNFFRLQFVLAASIDYLALCSLTSKCWILENFVY